MKKRTAVEVLAGGVFQFDPGEGNYWGYNPISFFAPHNAYAHRCDACDQHTEFRELFSSRTPGRARTTPTRA